MLGGGSGTAVWPMAQASPPQENAGSLQRLLVALAADPDVAGRRYEALRARLVLLFRSRGCAAPEELADVTLDRVAERLAAGVEVRDLVGYAIGVAQLVAKEGRRRDLRSQPLDEAASPAAAPGWAEAEDEVDAARRLRCLERCLDQIGLDDRRLVLAYMLDQGAARIRARARIAAELSISLNALRIRVHRLRAALERCVLTCCRPDQAGPRDRR
jgi:DNA-directed RNA polymerase specialized sigma24 family protein